MSEEIKSSEQSNSGQTAIVNQQKPNSIGTAGFVFAAIALFHARGAAVLGWIVWTLGLILSFVGVFRTPKGMAIAGLVISLSGIIILITALLGAATLFSTFF